ncbi:phosphatase PAP2 family protein [Abyssibius alkaniclasticus]|uniref:phosphatase PAP2 family protein n=1 Tax=Abyssibius alkaniclasticus TaxID=2881234 RepID=UPI004058E8C1
MPKISSFTTLVWLAIVALAAVSALFVLWPGLDLAIARWFGDATGFWLAQQGWAIALRLGLLWATRIIALLALLWLLLALLRGARARISWRYPAFAFFSFALGPWLLVNELFKNNWGRARPYQLAEFGGEAGFTPAWKIADQCSTNCSFVSGESGMSAATVLVLLVLFGREMSAWARALLVVLGVVGAALRIPFGGHFTSDVVIAALLCALVVAGFYALLLRDRPQPAAMWRGLRDDLRLR